LGPTLHSRGRSPGHSGAPPRAERGPIRPGRGRPNRLRVVENFAPGLGPRTDSGLAAPRAPRAHFPTDA